MTRTLRCIALLIGTSIVTGCAAHAIPHTDPSAPGFWLGLWQGIIAPIAFIVGLFNHNVAVYAIPNKGWLYDLGFILGLSGWLAGGRASSKRRRS